MRNESWAADLSAPAAGPEKTPPSTRNRPAVVAAWAALTLPLMRCSFLARSMTFSIATAADRTSPALSDPCFSRRLTFVHSRSAALANSLRAFRPL